MSRKHASIPKSSSGLSLSSLSCAGDSLARVIAAPGREPSLRQKKLGSYVAAISMCMIFAVAIRSCIPKEVTAWHKQQDHPSFRHDAGSNSKVGTARSLVAGEGRIVDGSTENFLYDAYDNEAVEDLEEFSAITIDGPSGAVVVRRLNRGQLNGGDAGLGLDVDYNNHNNHNNDNDNNNGATLEESMEGATEGTMEVPDNDDSHHHVNIFDPSSIAADAAAYAPALPDRHLAKDHKPNTAAARRNNSDDNLYQSL